MARPSRVLLKEELAYMKQWAAKASCANIGENLLMSEQQLGAYMKKHGMSRANKGARYLVVPDRYTGPTSYVQRGRDNRFVNLFTRHKIEGNVKLPEKPWSIEQSFENPILLVSATAGVMIWRNSGKGECL